MTVSLSTVLGVASSLNAPTNFAWLFSAKSESCGTIQLTTASNTQQLEVTEAKAQFYIHKQTKRGKAMAQA